MKNLERDFAALRGAAHSASYVQGHYDDCALSRSANRAFDSFRDPALLVPLAGAGVLIYLAVPPLLMLVVGASRRKAPRIVYTFKLSKCLRQRYTYSTFKNCDFRVWRRLSVVYLGTVLLGLRNAPILQQPLFAIMVVPLICRECGVDCLIFLLSPKFGYLNVWLMNILVFKRRFNVFSARMIWVHSVGHAVGIFDDGGGILFMDPSLEESAMMSGANNWQTFKRDHTLAHAHRRFGGAHFVRSHLGILRNPALIGIPAHLRLYQRDFFAPSTNIRSIMAASRLWPWACCFGATAFGSGAATKEGKN
jgi:hypothetical protein